MDSLIEYTRAKKLIDFHSRLSHAHGVSIEEVGQLVEYIRGLDLPPTCDPVDLLIRAVDNSCDVTNQEEYRFAPISPYGKSWVETHALNCAKSTIYDILNPDA